MADTVSVITLLLAITTAWVAILTYRSQQRVEKVQDMAYRSQVKMEELQLMMEKREADSRRIRATIALSRIEQTIHTVCNWTSGFNISHDLLRSIADWPNEVASLPDCTLKSRSEDALRRVVVNSESKVESLVRQTINHLFSQLRDDLPVLVDECREKIKGEM